MRPSLCDPSWPRGSGLPSSVATRAACLLEYDWLSGDGAAGGNYRRHDAAGMGSRWPGKDGSPRYFIGCRSSATNWGSSAPRSPSHRSNPLRRDGLRRYCPARDPPLFCSALRQSLGCRRRTVDRAEQFDREHRGLLNGKQELLLFITRIPARGQGLAIAVTAVIGCPPAPGFRRQSPRFVSRGASPFSAELDPASKLRTCQARQVLQH